MRLVIATPHYPPEPGGPATYAKILADNFPGLGVAVEVVRFQRVRSYPKLLRHILYLAMVIHAARRADVILALDPVSTGVPSALASILVRKPLVAKIVGDRAWERAQQGYNLTASPEQFVKIRRVPFRLALYRQAQRWVARRAKSIIVPSAGLKRIITAWGIPSAKIHVVYNSVEPCEPAAVPEAVLSVQGFTVVTVARLIRLKHIDAVIAAVGRMPGTSLIVIGDGPERVSLERLANNNPAIHFTGALPNDQAMAIMASADVLVLNSSWETFSHVLIEGLMTPIPIIATDTGGNRDILEDSGVLVPVGDSVALTRELQRLKDDPNLRDQLRQSAKLRARAFASVTMLDATRAILESAR